MAAQKRKYRDYPEEIWREIFEKLDDKSLAQVSLASKKFLSITNSSKTILKISDQILPVLVRLLERFQYLEKIIICIGSLDCLAGVFRKISQSRLSDEAKKRLKKFDFRAPTSIPCELDFATFLDCFPMLEEINFHNEKYSKRTENCKEFQKLASNLRKLKKMSFNGDCNFLNGESIISLSLNSQDLEEICIESSKHHVTKNAIGSVMRNCPKLTALTLHSLEESPINSNFSIENSIAYAKKLQTLCFYEMYISNQLLYSIAKAKPPLKKLTMAPFKGIKTNTMSMFFQTFCSIEDLHLQSINLDDDSFDIISTYLTKLTRINLRNCRDLSNHSLFLLTNSCPLLEEINMDSTRVGVGDISHINLRKYEKIRRLSLCKNKYLDDNTLNTIARVCSNLQFLNISYCHLLTGEGISEIFNSCPFLTHLEITDLKIPYFSKNSFEGRIVNLKVLRAGCSKMDDEAMCEIARICPDLEFLDIEKCKNVTKFGIMEVVKNCKKLEEINLAWCGNLNIEDLNIMVQARPSLRKISVHLDFIISEEEQRNLFMKCGCKILANSK